MNMQTGAISPKFTLSLLGLMFLIPLTLAWLMHNGVIDFTPGSGVNKGTLIDPPVAAQVPEDFARLGLDEHWVLAHFPGEYCDGACEERLYGLNQMLRALGRDAVRVRILLLSEPGETASELPLPEGSESVFTSINTDTIKLSQQFNSLGDTRGIFIIDPLGNIMMRYAPETTPDDMLSDMERLLQYQKTDPQ